MQTVSISCYLDVSVLLRGDVAAISAFGFRTTSQMMETELLSSERAGRAKQQKPKFAKQTFREQRDVYQLNNGMAKRGKVSPGGRRPKRPATVEEALGQIERLAQQWMNWVEMMSNDDDQSGVGIKSLPDAVERAVNASANATHSLAKEVKNSRDRRKKT